MAKKPKASSDLIIANKKARFEYHLHEQFEAGLALKGWEVKSLRAGRVQLTDSYVQVEKGEAFCTVATSHRFQARLRILTLTQPATESSYCTNVRSRA